MCGVLVLYLASIEALEEDHSHRPDIYLVGNLRRLLPHHKTLWREIPGKHMHRIRIMSINVIKSSNIFFANHPP